MAQDQLSLFKGLKNNKAKNSRNDEELESEKKTERFFWNLVLT